MAKNEATLETRISQVLSSVFPTFRQVNVRHQESFSINFGHHHVKVNLKEPSKRSLRAIFDILLTVDNKNIILLELKKEDKKLEAADVDQGISYARLIHPMPPITIISNGKSNLIYNTYTKSKIKKLSIDENYIQQLIDDSFELAANDFKDAINLLLNKDHDLFSRIINEITKEKFLQSTGPIDNVTKAICLEFSIDREIIPEIYNYLNQSIQLIGLVGHPFSGKTNILHQLFLEALIKDDYFLYIDCHDYNYSIFQLLANKFSGLTRNNVNIDKIRDWLINSINLSDKKFILGIDNFSDTTPASLRNEIIELLDIFKSKNCYIVYTIDEYSYKKIAYIENRKYKTIIGDRSKILKINELNDNEYSLAKHLLLTSYRLFIEQGGQQTPEYRQVRILRHLAIVIKNDHTVDFFEKIIAVPDLTHLQSFVSLSIYTREVHDFYKKIANCFFLQTEERNENAEYRIIAQGTGAISSEFFKTSYPNEYGRLLNSAFVVERSTKEGFTYIYPKLPELIAYWSIELVGQFILEKVHLITIKELVEIFISYVIALPYSDLVGAGVLLGIAYNYNDGGQLFSDLIQELLKIPPTTNKLENGHRYLLFAEDFGTFQLESNSDSEEELVSNFLPYIILSQVASHPLRLMDNKDYTEYAYHLYLLDTLGSSKFLLRRADVRAINNMKFLESYEWEGIGQVVKGTEGIVEPIVQSIQKNFYIIPNEIKLLILKAIDENNFPLVWRLYLALRPLRSIDDEAISKQIQDYLDLFSEYFKEFMTKFLTIDITDPLEREQHEIWLNSINLNL